MKGLVARTFFEYVVFSCESWWCYLVLVNCFQLMLLLLLLLGRRSLCVVWKGRQIFQGVKLRSLLHA